MEGGGVLHERWGRVLHVDVHVLPGVPVKGGRVGGSLVQLTCVS